MRNTLNTIYIALYQGKFWSRNSKIVLVQLGPTLFCFSYNFAKIILNSVRADAQMLLNMTFTHAPLKKSISISKRIALWQQILNRRANFIRFFLTKITKHLTERHFSYVFLYLTLAQKNMNHFKWWLKREIQFSLVNHSCAHAQICGYSDNLQVHVWACLIWKNTSINAQTWMNCVYEWICLTHLTKNALKATGTIIH